MLHHHLVEILASLKLNLARVKCLALLIAGLLRHRTVNLTYLATEKVTGATNQSCYRRFQRFFRDCALNLGFVGRLILGKIPRQPGGRVLSMDRTNWKHGKRHLNILTIGAVINNVAIPIAWKVLPQSTKRGNSSTDHHIALFKKVLPMRPEDTHITNGKKLEKLVALVSLAFLYSFAWGCHLRATRKTPKAMLRKSLFRQGLKDVHRLLSNSCLKPKETNDFLTWLSGPFHDLIFVA